jgi:hypothetical protein
MPTIHDSPFAIAGGKRVKLMKRPTFRFAIAVAALSAALMNGTPLAAQAVRGTIQGSVTDSSGGALPGVTVEAKNVATGIVQNVVTNSEGRYTAPDLPIGDYEVTAALQGFQTVIRRGITLRVGSQVLVDFQLPVGQLQETLTVTGAAPTIDTVSSAVGAVIEQKQIADLPLNGRNFSQLISLAPGANEIPFGAAGGNAFFGRQSNFTVSGARPEGQAFLLDNTNIQGFWNRGPGSGVFGTTLGVEAISEFQTLTNTYSAQFGGNGAVVNAVTKSGTNQMHGSAFEFYRNSKMDSKNYFDVLGKQPFEKHQFGGSLGGPLKENKAFFFGTYEGISQDRSETRIVTVPDESARLGIVNGVNVGVDPAIGSLLPLYPAPTLPQTAQQRAAGVAQAAVSGASPGHENYALGRLDYNLDQSTSLFGRYVTDTAKVFDAFAGSSIPGWGADQSTNNQYFTSEVRRIISQSVINQSRFGLVRTHESAFTRDAVSPLDFFPGENRQNGVVNAGSGVTGVGGQTTLPVNIHQNRYTAADDVYVNRGSHSIKLGAGLEWTNSSMDQPFQGSGVWSFPNLTSFLQNRPTQFIGAAPHAADSLRQVKELYLISYVNDDWRVANTLTLNLGVRYNPGINPKISGGPGGPKQITDYPLGQFVTVDRAFGQNPSLKNVDPRVGFAWDPTESHKTSVRGGFGVFHNPVGPRIILPNYVNNPPYIFGNEVLNVNGAVPRFPVPYSSSAGTPPINVSNGIDYHLDSEPYISQWNVNIQREILPSTSVTVGYVGSRGSDLLKQVDVNPVVPSTINGTTVYGIAQAGRSGLIPNPRQNPVYSSLTYNIANTWSEYHSLQTSLNRRFTKGVQAQVSYTLSKCTDLSSGSFGGEGSTPSTNPYDVDYDEGPCYFDRRHNFRGSAIWALPFTGNAFVEGWELSTIVSAVSGRPFTPGIGFDQSGLGTGNQRPNLADGRDIGDVVTGDINQWFDPTAFTLPAPGTLGTVGRHSLRGPKFFTTDLTVMRNIRFGEKQVQLRLEGFNIFNNNNFNLPNANVFVQAPGGTATISPTAGQITSALAPRQMQIAVKFNF